VGERLDILQYVKNELTESLSGKTGSADDLRHEIEQAEHNFDFDSYAPYTHQESDVISDLEKEYWRDAEDILGDTTYKATEWEDARRAYASALAYTAYSSLWEQTKRELIEEIEQFESDARDVLPKDCYDDPQITLSLSCLHGWAAHNREDADGTMFFESRQLDGCNGLAKKTSSEVWLSVCFTPKADEQNEVQS
jgi:hypothetical protein